MIFLSHTSSDKPIVDTIANRLATVFGFDNIFYDSWSIQPGDGIIGKMNEGLANCKYFFFFVSKKSLQSEMVKLEWQNALYKSTRNEVKIVPVKIDDSMMPTILLQNLYIDVFGQGVETAIRQMIDVASNKNTYQPQIGFQNIRAYAKFEKTRLHVEFRAEVYMEPHSKYVILVDNFRDELEVKAIGEAMFHQGFQENILLNNGDITNVILIARESATSPNFPFVIEVTAKNQSIINLKGISRFTSRDRFEAIPIIFL